MHSNFYNILKLNFFLYIPYHKMPARLTQEEYIERAHIIHNNKYDYSLTVYTRGIDHIIIICPKHGEFTQRADTHLEGRGCKRCGELRASPSTEEFIKLAIEKHGDRYDYSETVYVHSETSVTIICKTHGRFQQAPKDHLAGRGCRACHTDSIRSTNEKFVKKSIERYGTDFDLSKVKYTRADDPVILICSTCKYEFKRIARNHLVGRLRPCVKCYRRSRIKTREQFIKEARAKHKNKYNYSKVVYVNAKTPVLIYCSVCKITFSQTPDNHLQGKGCKRCNKCVMQEITRSIIERVSERKFVQLNPDFLYGLELDGYCEELNCAFEYQGVQHYKFTPFFHKNESDFTEQQNRDFKKRIICQDRGIRLIEVSYVLKSEEEIETFIIDKLIELKVMEYADEPPLDIPVDIVVVAPPT
jgi:protein-arginine kinase activator protein McsA